MTKKRMTLDWFNQIIYEIGEQHAWRSQADREMDYADGNQLNSDVLNRQKELGIPPAQENVMGEVFGDIIGRQRKEKKDFKVIPDGDKSGDNVAKAIGYKLNQAERESGADRACSTAYDPQVKAGIGWVEVSRESNPFKFPYRCKAIPRNRIWWDMTDHEPDLSNSRWLVRREWVQTDIIKSKFPGKEDLIERIGKNEWNGYLAGDLTSDGGESTGLAFMQDQERGFSVEEEEWRNVAEGKISIYEVWYRVWEDVLVLKMSNGRVVEFDRENELHLQAIALGVPIQKATIDKVRLAFFLGPYMLHDGPSPYKHNKFPYVSFWGKKEDRTGIPFGLARDMMFLQDEVNARISKQQWLLSSRRVERTEDVVAMTDNEFRKTVARPDPDIVLDKEEVKDGGFLKIEDNFELNAQQAARLTEAREGIRRAGRVTDSFQGRAPGQTSGILATSMIEQTVQGLAEIDDNYAYGRMQVGTILMHLILEDMEGKQEDVLIDGGILNEDEIVTLNNPAYDHEADVHYLDNDTSRTMLKVVLQDVPSTPSFRSQQLYSMSESFKSAPQEVQLVILPYLVNLMDIPNKEEVVRAVKEISSQPSQDDIQKMIDEHVEAALTKANIDLKSRELDIKERKTDAEIEKIIAEKVQKYVESIFSAEQTAVEVATNPELAPMTDQIFRSAGGKDQDEPPIVATAEGAPAFSIRNPRQKNTSPMFPPRASKPRSAKVGAKRDIEELESK